MIINLIYILLSSFVFFWFYKNIKKNGLIWIVKGLLQIGILVLFSGCFLKIFITLPPNLYIKIIFLFIIIFFYLRNFLKLNRKQKVLNAKKLTTFNKKNLKNWMNLTKKERYNLSKQDSFKYMDRRKLLLDEIRKEYKKVSRENSERNIKKQ